MWKRTAVFILLAVMVLLQIGCGQPKTLPDMIRQSAEALDNAQKEENTQTGSSLGDWTAMVCALSGDKKQPEKYLTELERYIAQQYSENGNLSQVKATEYHRAALTILALGGDPADMEEDGEQVNLIADGTWNFPGGSPGLQGANGLIYALLTLDSKKYETPEKGIREQYIEELLTYQKDSGAFCLDNSLDGDIDITAMALQALAPYMEKKNVKQAVDSALSWLEEELKDGSISGEDGSAESSAQMILALCALGKDPAEEERFVIKEQTLLDGLNTYRLKNGMYTHDNRERKENMMATYQSMLALEAVQKLRSEQRWIWDFTAE